MRKLATAAAVGMALASSGAKALSLGEIEMRSALNQPIDAEIWLLSVAAGELDGMIVKLASAEAFARAGIERSRVLTDLKFDVTTGANGQPVILISSKKPILEPFLNFLVDVDWRGGRLVREYTVLLDPPVFMTPNAGLRDTSTDTPTTIPLATEDSILTPLPIDRDAAGEEVQFDESEVALIGEAVEIGDAQVGNVDVNLGEVVELDGFGDVVEIGGLTEVEDNIVNESFSEDSVVVIPGAEIENGVTTLSDTDVALIETELPAIIEGEEITYDPSTGWDVAVVGDGAEVSDNVGTSVGALETVTLLSEDGGTEVELGTEINLLDETTVASTSANNGSNAAGSDVLVNQNDTLWEIADANKVGSLSTQQMMLALLEANQQAFINGNINLVKAGAVLRVPNESSVAPLTQAQALAEVSSQEQLWRQYRDNLRGVQSNSTAIAAAPEPEDTGAETEEPVSTSAAAQQILDEARDELRKRLEADAQNVEELQIVADNTSSSTVASATADETNTPDTNKLGSINRKLQLAREELAAARLESEELSSQSSELDNVTNNMDQLVTMQQDKLAKLQSQLAEAQKNEQLAAEQALEEQKTAAESALDNTVADAGETLQAGVDGVVDGASDAAQVAATSVSDTVTDVTGLGADGDALAADPTAEPIELASLDDDASAVQEDIAAAEVIPPERQGPWYESLMTRNGAIIGGAAGLGLAGLFLLLRRRKQGDDEELLDHVEFIDDEHDMNAAPVVAGNGLDNDFSADMTDMTGENVSLDESMDGMTAAKVGSAAAVASTLGADSTLNIDDLNQSEASVASDNGFADDTASNDDTISEAEVYLAYGLHGQAEDLLSKAVERNPTNPEYRVKLLQTYHAQRNQPAFEQAAAAYHKDFGGSASPDWNVVSALGQEMNASNELFLGNSDDLESLGKGDFDAPKLDSNDFLSDGSAETVSQVREFSSSADISSADLERGLEDSSLQVDESDLMDQSLDPGFAFDENDLEATGDFSKIADELNQEKAANESSTAPAELLDDGIIEFDAPELASLDETQMALDKVSDDSISQDLSMDLDQLSGDMELDSTEMLDGGLELSQELEMPDLTSNTDLTADSTNSFGDVDEMDTMMDLAKAYIDMGDNDSASSALGEIVKSGSPEQKTEAENLLRKIS